MPAWILELIDREPARASYGGRAILTNPPPSSGGILIAYSLDLLERLGRPGDLRALVEVMDATNRARTEEFVDGLQREGYLERFMAKRMGAKTIEIEASHLALISHPDAITDLIVEALAV